MKTDLTSWPRAVQEGARVKARAKIDSLGNPWQSDVSEFGLQVDLHHFERKWALRSRYLGRQILRSCSSLGVVFTGFIYPMLYLDSISGYLNFSFGPTRLKSAIKQRTFSRLVSACWRV